MEREELITEAEIGRRLGVSRKQVYMWHHRRTRNGFPAVADVIGRHPLFRWPAVERWRAGYVPKRGGRPPRNRTKQDI